MNVEIFALYIISHYSRFLYVHENMYDIKITLIIPLIGNIVKNGNINPCEIVNIHKFANIYTRENIYIHSKS